MAELVIYLILFMIGCVFMYALFAGTDDDDNNWPMGDGQTV